MHAANSIILSTYLPSLVPSSGRLALLLACACGCVCVCVSDEERWEWTSSGSPVERQMKAREDIILKLNRKRSPASC